MYSITTRITEVPEDKPVDISELIMTEQSDEYEEFCEALDEFAGNVSTSYFDEYLAFAEEVEELYEDEPECFESYAGKTYRYECTLEIKRKDSGSPEQIFCYSHDYPFDEAEEPEEYIALVNSKHVFSDLEKSVMAGRCISIENYKWII